MRFPLLNTVLAVMFLSLSALIQVQAAPKGNREGGIYNYAGVSLGYAAFTQHLSTEQNKVGGGVAGNFGSAYSFVHLGLNYIEVGRQDTFGQGAGETNTFEDLKILTFGGGLIFNRWIKLDVGYGKAWFTHDESTPNTSPVGRTTYSAEGTGWIYGFSLTPLNVGLMWFGVSGYYYDAEDYDYKTKIQRNGTTTESTGGRPVHAYGWFAGLSCLFGL
jgi:hypothetical protein